MTRKLLLIERDQAVCLAVPQQQAADALGISLSHFKRHVAPQLRCVYSGRARLYRVAELERWLKDNEEPTLSDRRQAAGTSPAPEPTVTRRVHRAQAVPKQNRQAA
jgi:hypothetical protein